MTTKAEVLEQARQVFASYDSQSRDDAGKLLSYNHVVQHPSLVAARITKPDIDELYANQMLGTSNVLNSFGRDPIFVIMSKCRPIDVIALCQINRSFFRVTSDSLKLSS